MLLGLDLKNVSLSNRLGNGQEEKIIYTFFLTAVWRGTWHAIYL